MGHQFGRPASGPSHVCAAPPTRSSIQGNSSFWRGYARPTPLVIASDDSLEKSSARALLAPFLALPGSIFTPYPETCANPQPYSFISDFSSSLNFLSFIFSLFHCPPCALGFLAPGLPDVAARVLYNRQRPRMLSRPAAAIIFPLASLNTGSVAQRENTAISGDSLRRRWRPISDAVQSPNGEHPGGSRGPFKP